MAGSGPAWSGDGVHYVVHYVEHSVTHTAQLIMGALCDAGSDYMPGLIGLNNIKNTDYVNVVVQSLSRVPPAGSKRRPAPALDGGHSAPSARQAPLRAQGAPPHPAASPRGAAKVAQELLEGREGRQGGQAPCVPPHSALEMRTSC